MTHATLAVPAAPPHLRYLEAFRLSGEHGPQALARFLPPKGDPDYLDALEALVEGDCEHYRRQGTPRIRGDYQDIFPGLRNAGSASTPNSFGGKLGDSVYAAPKDAYPKVGTEIDGYRLVEELGRGAFGRVYLAEERRLANRRVVLKLTSKPSAESETLARLQHTNIVPIQTASRVGPLWAVQMPWLGRQTLADLILAARAEQSFASMPGRVFTTTMARVSTSSPVRPVPREDSDTTPLPGTLKRGSEPGPVRRMLAGLNYVDAVVWVMSRLADGLAHAHERGILHLDLKPQNVLLSDDGQPMLLDFNLAVEANRAARGTLGGTWPYMPPEQMLRYAGREAVVDGRTDLFALGVIFFELLTGRYPFACAVEGRNAVDAAIAVRYAGAPDVRALNAAVSPGVAAIVAKLLAGRADDRYPSATLLRNDLERHQQHLPLTTAPNTCLTERISKWRKRNPRLLQVGTVAGLLTLALGLAGGLYQMNLTRERDRAALHARQLLADVATDRSNLVAITERERRWAARDRAEVWLREPLWEAALPPASRKAVADARGELMLLLAHNAQLDGHTDRQKQWQARAAEQFPDGEPARVSLFLRAERRIAVGDYFAAIGPLLELTETDRDHYAAQFALAWCYHHTTQTARALERYQIARAIFPADPRPSLNRGVLLHDQRRYAEAERELTDALQRDPNYADTYWSRALVRRSQKNLRGAVADLSTGLAKGLGGFRAHSMRAALYDELGERTLAATDRAALLQLTPSTEQDFATRATLTMEADPRAAVRDLEEATRRNPTYLPAWQILAYVYADKLNDLPRAIAAIERAVAINPEEASARMNRAVLLARRGDRKEAHRDVERALANTDDGLNFHQAACVYALTSRTHGDDQMQSLGYVRQALRLGFPPAEVEHDVDLVSLREVPEFRSALAAVRERVR